MFLHYSRIFFSSADALYHVKYNLPSRNIFFRIAFKYAQAYLMYSAYYYHCKYYDINCSYIEEVCVS